jgi:hypothetical protein
VLFTSPIFVIIGLIVYAVAGLSIGAVVGCLSFLILKSKPLKIFKDACLGSLGFVLGFYGCVFMPWHRNTISYRLAGGTEVTSTADIYQHPDRIGIIFAILLPLLYELYRWNRLRTNKSSVAVL